MSTYNEKEEHLREAINSILNQTYSNLEFIIINDNPKNIHLNNILSEYEIIDKRVKIILNEINIGLAKSLNKGINISKGKFIVRMDADDISMNERIEKQIQFLMKHNLDMVSSLKTDIDESGNILEKQKGNLLLSEDIKFLLPYAPLITHPSVIFNKNKIVQLNGYRDIPSAEDYDLWLRMIKHNYKIGIIDQSLIYYRLRENSISRKDIYKQLLINKYIRRLHKKGTLEECDIEIKINENLRKNKYFNVLYREKFNKYYEKFLIGLNQIKNPDKSTNKGIKEVVFSFFSNKSCSLMIIDYFNYQFIKIIWKFRRSMYK